MFGIFDFGGNEKKTIKTYDAVEIADHEQTFERFEGNPILKADPSVPWKAKAVYNPAAIYLDRKIHLIYRGQSQDGVSSFGYAQSSDGYHIDEDFSESIYRPTAPFELPTKDGWNSGCEDPRISLINDRIYMCYTAYDGTSPPRVALTSIAASDFLNKNWLWDVPKLISPPGIDDKDACIIKNPSGKGFVAFHRLGNSLWIDMLRDLEFPEVKYLTGGILAQAREDAWDNVKIGLASPPIMTIEGLLVLYHSVCNPGFIYKIGALLLDPTDLHKIIARTSEPLLIPEMDYELNGQVQNSVFCCGAVVIKDIIYLYYGGGDTVTGVATMPVSNLLDVLLKRHN